MPKLATLIGLNEAIVLQQVHYWLKIKERKQQDYIDGHYWVYNTYEQWQEQFPFWSIMTIRRVMTKLEHKKLLIVGNYNQAGFDKTKWYTINYDELNNLNFTSVQNEHMDCSDCTNRTVQNEQTSTIDYTENTTENSLNVLQGAKLKNCTSFSQKSFKWSILEKQIIKTCHKQGVDDCFIYDYIEIIKYYYLTYMETFNEEHPRLSNSSMESVIRELRFGSEQVEDVDIDTYKLMIKKHFETQYYNCDYSICHFMTEGIRNNRYYETRHLL